MTDTTTSPAPQTSESPRHDDAVLLSGWPLRLARALLLILVAWGAVVMVFSIPSWHRFRTEVQPVFDSLHIRPNWGQGHVVSPWNGGIAEKAELPRGELLAIAGQPVTKVESVFEVAERLRGPLGRPVKLTVRGDDGKVVTKRLVRSLPPWGDGLSPTSVSLINQIIAAVVFLLGGLTLLWRGGPSLVAIVGATSFLCLGIGGITGNLENQVGGGWSDPILRVITPIGALGLFTFLTLFPTGRVRPRWAWSILVIATTEQARSWFDIEVPVPVMFLLSVVFPLILAAQIVRYRRYANEEQRLQTKWAVLGIVAFMSTFLLMLAGISQLPDDALLGRELLLSVSSLGLLVFISGVVISLLKYRLWDAEAAWSRSAMAAGLTLAVTAIVGGGTAIAQAAFGTSGPLALGLATIVAAVLLVPLQHRLSEWAKYRFLRELIELKEHLPQLVEHLRETESVEGIAEAVTDRTAPVVHATHMALVMPDNHGRWIAAGVEGVDHSKTEAWAAEAGLASPPALRGTRRHPWRDRVWCEPQDRLFPVRIALRSERAGGELAVEGWLLLGPRPDGSGYGPDDLEAVAEIAGPVGRALRVVRVREDRAAKLATMLVERDAKQTEVLKRIQAQLRNLLPE